MYTLNFFGPFHLGNFGNHTKKQIDSPHTKGVYVWGFAYDKNGFIKFDKQTDFDPETMKFLPYYVGKHESSILDRILQHKNFRYTGPDKNIHAPKYMRLSENYMFEFLKDKDFPIFTSDKSKKLIDDIIKKNQPKKTITYHNNIKVLGSIYPSSKAVKSGTDHPITLQSFVPIEDDTLYQLAETYNNFYFCYIPVQTNELRIKYLEHYLFYCLKGKTISQTNTFPQEGMSPQLFKLEDKTRVNILKKNASGEIIASNDFPGY